jgi:hypothetical protein
VLADTGNGFLGRVRSFASKAAGVCRCGPGPKKSRALGKSPLFMEQLLKEEISLPFPGEGKNDEEIIIYIRDLVW